MKKIFSQVVFVLFAMTFMVSCNSDKSQVKNTAEDFLKAITSGDFTKSKSLATPETQEKWGNFLQMIADNMDQPAKDAVKSSLINVSDVVVNGDKAEATCSSTIPYFIQQTTVLHLTKVDGKWMIDEPNAIVFDQIRTVESVVGLDVDMPADSVAAQVENEKPATPAK